MENYCKSSYTVPNITSSLIIIIPLCWGIYEFRQFRIQTEDIKKITYKIHEAITINENFQPLLQNLNTLITKINRF